MSYLRISGVAGGRIARHGLLIARAVYGILAIMGCSDRVQLPTQEQVVEFRRAGPSGPTVDMDKVVEATLRTGPYRVRPGEVIEVTLSAFLGTVTAGQAIGLDQVTPIVCRINDSGKIILPVVGELPVAGKTLSEIEASVIGAYYPAYAKTYPSVFVKLLESKPYRVSIVGAVTRPGVYGLRSDQMSLVSLLMEAGGLAREGAASIRIIRAGSGYAGLTSLDPTPAASAGLGGVGGRWPEPEYKVSGVPVRLASWVKPVQGVDDSDGKRTGRLAAMPSSHNGFLEDPSRTLILPMKGINIPFSDIALREGDRVVVERLVMPLFTVIGLVNRPGNFEYPPDAHFNLIQALGFAGGPDLRLDPRYVVVYRLNSDGSIVHAAFQFSNPKEQGALAGSAAVAIKPGDIIAVEHTPRTRTKEFLDRIFNVNVGAYIPLVR